MLWSGPGRPLGGFFLQGLKVKVLVAQPCLTLCDPMDCSPPRLLCPWNSPLKNNEVGSHSLPQGIFLTQESNPGLLQCRWILFLLSHQEAPLTPFKMYQENQVKKWTLILPPSVGISTVQCRTLLNASLPPPSMFPSSFRAPPPCCLSSHLCRSLITETN